MLLQTSYLRFNHCLFVLFFFTSLIGAVDANFVVPISNYLGSLKSTKDTATTYKVLSNVNAYLRETFNTFPPSIQNQILNVGTELKKSYFYRHPKIAAGIATVFLIALSMSFLSRVRYLYNVRNTLNGYSLFPEDINYVVESYPEQGWWSFFKKGWGPPRYLRSWNIAKERFDKLENETIKEALRKKEDIKKWQNKFQEWYSKIDISGLENAIKNITQQQTYQNLLIKADHDKKELMQFKEILAGEGYLWHMRKWVSLCNSIFYLFPTLRFSFSFIPIRSALGWVTFKRSVLFTLYEKDKRLEIIRTVINNLMINPTTTTKVILQNLKP